MMGTIFLGKSYSFKKLIHSKIDSIILLVASLVGSSILKLMATKTIIITIIITVTARITLD